LPSERTVYHHSHAGKSNLELSQADGVQRAGDPGGPAGRNHLAPELQAVFSNAAGAGKDEHLALIEGRLLSWMIYGFQAEGLLFWHVNLGALSVIASLGGEEPRRLAMAGRGVSTS